MSIETMENSIARSIERYGSIVRLEVAQDGVIDFTTGKPAQTIVIHDMLGIIGKYDSSEIVPGIVNIDDIKCAIMFDGDVKKGDIVILNSKRYTVLNVKMLVRENRVIKKTLQLRS